MDVVVVASHCDRKNKLFVVVRSLRRWYLLLSIHATRHPVTYVYSLSSLISRCCFTRLGYIGLSAASSKTSGSQLGGRIITYTVTCTADTGSGARYRAQTTPKERGERSLLDSLLNRRLDGELRRLRLGPERYEHSEW